MSHDIAQSKGDGMDVASWAVILVLVVSPFLVIGCIVCMIVCCDCNHYGEMVLPKKAPWFRKRLIKLSLVSKKVHDHPKLQRQHLCKSQPIVLRRIRPAQADNFTVATELELESQYNHSQCVICLETYNIGDSISWARNTMYCNHAFHTHCIQKWLKNKRSCPCCRYEILRWDDMHMRVNAWSDYCCGRRSRVRNDKMQRNLLHQCRETGEYCVEHGLVFPFVQPTLEDPYEAQISELEECLVLAKEHALRSRIKSSGAQQQQQHPHQCEEGSGAIVTTTRSTTNTAVESTAETTLEGNDELEGHVNCAQANASSRESLSLSQQTTTTDVGLNGRGSLILFETANETDATNNTRSVRLQGILGAHAIPLRMSTARSYE